MSNGKGSRRRGDDRKYRENYPFRKEKLATQSSKFMSSALSKYGIGKEKLEKFVKDEVPEWWRVLTDEERESICRFRSLGLKHIKDQYNA